MVAVTVHKPRRPDRRSTFADVRRHDRAAAAHRRAGTGARRMSRRLAQGLAAGPPRARPPDAVARRRARREPRRSRGDAHAALADLQRLPLVDEVRASAPSSRSRVQARRSGCRCPGVPQRRRARHDPARPVGAAGMLHAIEDATRPRAARALGRPHARPRPHRLRRRRQQRRPRCMLPHPRAAERDFVLVPVAVDRPRRRAAGRRPGRRPARRGCGGAS